MTRVPEDRFLTITCSRHNLTKSFDVFYRVIYTGHSMMSTSKYKSIALFILHKLFWNGFIYFVVFSFHNRHLYYQFTSFFFGKLFCQFLPIVWQKPAQVSAMTVFIAYQQKLPTLHRSKTASPMTPDIIYSSPLLHIFQLMLALLLITNFK